jgi:hypothetical protein
VLRPDTPTANAKPPRKAHFLIKSQTEDRMIGIEALSKILGFTLRLGVFALDVVFSLNYHKKFHPGGR